MKKKREKKSNQIHSKAVNGVLPALESAMDFLGVQLAPPLPITASKCPTLI